MLELLPIAAAFFGVPQYLPQILKLRATGDTTGVSWSWAALTSVNNAAWFVYFMLSGYWTAGLPSTAASVLAGTIAVMLIRRGTAWRRAAGLIAVWVGLLICVGVIGGRIGLGSLLATALIVQVTPSLWTAYRTKFPTGISQATWALVFGELCCWLVFGLCKADARLTVLGATGAVASVAMLARARQTSRRIGHLAITPEDRESAQKL
ncbi:PQ-loop domain-containing transporter [Kribbella sp. NPDC048915]|uniref:PQ-loop domain-containing transporter n=1 Tax=Kribbella sp. NPDC048915 TaxID=3155148 RepID=UPI00340CF869